MTHRPIPLAAAVAEGCVHFREIDNALWIGTMEGSILSLRLQDQRLVVHGAGYQNLVAVLPANDGISLFTVESGGSVWCASRQTTSRAEATLIADLARPLVAAQLEANGTTALVLESGPEARLVRVDLTTGTEVLLDGFFTDPVAFIIDSTAGTATVLQGPLEARQRVEVDLIGGNVGPPLDLLERVVALVSAPSGAGLVLASDAGALWEIDLGGATGVHAGDAGGMVQGLARWGSLLLVVTDGVIQPIEWGLAEGPIVIAAPLGPVITNGFASLEVDLADSGARWNEIRLELKDGDEAGIVSAATEPPNANGAHRVRVVTSPFPGERELSAVRIADGATLGRARIRVVRHWPNDDVGPPVAMTGSYRTLFARWGGGLPGPENLRKHAAPDVWRVAIVFVELAERAFQEPLATARPKWEQRLIGNEVSARRYYEEVSLRATAAGGSPLQGTTIALANGGIASPVRLESGWGDLFENDDQGKVTSDPFGPWWIKPDARAEVAGAYCDMLIDAGTAAMLLPQIDAVVFVIQNASEDVVRIGDSVIRTKSCWAQAWQGVNFHWKGPSWTTVSPKPCVFLPSDYPSAKPIDPGGMKSFTNILCHELGHTLGCGDLYDKQEDYVEAVNARAIGALDLMANEWRLPHFSLANRMRLGWIDPNWIETIDFGATPSSRNVTLQATESLVRAGLPAGRRAGIEVRIRPGRNYYFEYRRSQGVVQIGDNGLGNYYPASQLLVGTDVVGDGIDPIARPDILLLPKDADGDGPVLSVPSSDYSETDVTDPERQHDFRVILEQIEPGDANAVRVKVDYVRANRADLQVRPAPGRKPPNPPAWKSPDIDIEGPAGTNVIAKGHWHTIVVRVRNGGTVDADNVRLRIFTQGFTTTAGGAIEVVPPAPPQTIPKQQVREFRLPWWCPEHTWRDDIEIEHFCVRVVVDRYIDPRDASRNEIVVSNNSAQSNFDTTTANHGSPSERRSTGVVVGNALARRATYQLALDQDSDIFRAYLGAAWVRLAPHESRAVSINYESLAGDPVFGPAFDRAFNVDRPPPPNRLALTSLVAPRQAGPSTAAQIVFGANLTISAGLRTAIRHTEVLGEVVRGQVIAVRDKGRDVVTAGKVNIALWLAKRPENPFVTSAVVDGGGHFDAPTPPEIRAAFGREEIVGEAFYLGARLWGRCRSGIRRLG